MREPGSGNYQVRILLADDESDSLKTMFDLLKEFDYKISLAANGKMLVESAQLKNPDVIITDWEMPEMSGPEAISLLRKTDQFAETPVIVVTGLMRRPEDMDNAFRDGATDFITKPFEEIEFKARVSSAVRQSLMLRELKAKNRLLEQHLNLYSVQIIRKNQLLTQIKTVLENDLDQENSCKKKVIGLVDYSFRNDREWDDFTQMFSRLHPFFWELLHNRYAGLSRREKHLCALIRLGFGSKEIADVFGISVKSVHMSRYRIKAKICPNEEIELDTFISQIENLG